MMTENFGDPGPDCGNPDHPLKGATCPECGSTVMSLSDYTNGDAPLGQPEARALLCDACHFTLSGKDDATVAAYFRAITDARRAAAALDPDSGTPPTLFLARALVRSADAHPAHIAAARDLC